MIEDQSVLVLIVVTLLSLLAYSTHDMYTFVFSLDDFSFRRNGLNGLTRSGVGDLHLYKQPRHRSYFGTQTSIDSMQACPRYLRFIARWKV